MCHHHSRAVPGRLGLSVLASAAALLGGCAINPIVPWQASAERENALDSMKAARADAEALKKAFHDKAETFVGTKVALNDSLLGLGVLTLGLATGNAHRDTYTTTAALGGTAFLFGNQNLQGGVLAAYQSGIGQVNCAVAAVRPMQVSESDLTVIDGTAKELRLTLPRLSEAIARAEAAVASTPGLPAALSTSAQQQIDAARAAYAKAKAANANAADLRGAVTRAAGGLKGTLAEIHRTVNEFAAKGVADSSAVLESLKSLVSTITGFGKSVGVDVLTKQVAGAGAGSDGVAQSTRDGAPPVALPQVAPADLQPLTYALAELAKAEAETSALGDPLTTRLERYKSFDGTADLAKCQVTAGPAFTVDRSVLSFTANATTDQSARVVAKGGTKPYSGRFRDSPTFGVEVVSPYGQDSTFEVKVPKGVEAGKELALSITDGTSPPNEHIVTVKVVAPPPEGTNQSDRDGGTLQRALAQARGATFSVLAGGAAVRFTIGQAREDGNGRLLTLSCQPAAPATRPTRAAVTDQLLATLAERFALDAQSLKAARADRRQLSLQAPGCMQ